MFSTAATFLSRTRSSTKKRKREESLSKKELVDGAFAGLDTAIADVLTRELQDKKGFGATTSAVSVITELLRSAGAGGAAAGGAGVPGAAAAAMAILWGITWAEPK